MKKILTSFFLVLTFYFVVAQDSSSTKKVVHVSTFSGQAMLSHDGDAFYLNFGGPSVMANFGKIKIMIGMFPSLRIKEDPVRSTLTPILGTGPTLQYKKLLLGFPFYYIAASNVWKMSAGLGYKF